MRITVGGKRLFFDIEGPEYVLEDGRLARLPTLVLIHGAPGNSDHSVFKPAFSALRDVARIVYLDLSGAGRSDDDPDGFSLDRWADDLVAFCEQLEIEKPIVLGVSGGGFVAMAYGIRHPDHPAGLVLASTQARLDVQRALLEFERLGGAAAASAARTFLTERVDGRSTAEFGKHCMPVYNPTPQPARNSVIFRPKLAMAFHALDGIWHRMDLREELGRIRAPTLVLAGEDDPITPLQDSLDIVARMDPAIVRLEVFPAAGHGVWRDKPDTCFSVLREFIARCAAVPAS